MASSHRRHQQDSTRQSQTVFNILETEFVLSAAWTHMWTSLDPVSKYDVTLGNHAATWKLGQDKTRLSWHRILRNWTKLFRHFQSWPIFNSVCTTNADKTWQDRLVLSAVWTRHKSEITGLLAEDASHFLRVAVDRVKRPREAKAQNGTGKERREHNLLLPAHVCRLACEKPHRHHDECHKTCLIRITTWSG